MALINHSEAAGYRFGSQSVVGQGNADANGAEANDVSGQFYNPAILARQGNSQFQIGGTLVVPDLNYSDNGSSRFSGTQTGGDNPGRVAPTTAFAPTLYYSRPMTDRLTFGLGMFVPYAAKLDYGTAWPGRYSLDGIELKALSINPAFAFRLGEQHSVALGVSAEYMKATLNQAVDTPGAVRYLATHGAGSALIAGIVAAGGNPAALASVQDAHGQSSGSDWGAGFNLGYLYEPRPGTRLGVAYRSPVRHELHGNTFWDFSSVTNDAVVNQLIQRQSGKFDSGARVRITTPETVSAHAFHQIDPQWALMSDVTWARNSRLQALRIEFPGSTAGDEVIRQQWKDTLRLSFGLNYGINEQLTLRTGFALDQSPVRSSELTHPALPDANRHWYSAGLNIKMSKNASLDMAYSFVRFEDAQGNYTNDCSPLRVDCTGNGETTRGTYKTSLHMLGFSFTQQF
ncbi:OmpP1/FadL family transporter [Chitinivorax sp. PXF-14]|uniref:OmpP1/FadL family transporter n=1 Tax=Chitinivorax sp. PXF-14 TaxID=3230488 RepID=UPI0034672BD4